MRAPHDRKVTLLSQDKKGLQAFFDVYITHTNATGEGIREQLQASLEQLNTTQQCNKALQEALDQLD